MKCHYISSFFYIDLVVYEKYEIKSYFFFFATHFFTQYIHARQTQLAELQFDKLFITHRKPFHPASKDSIARWIKELLTLAGINTDLFTPHICCAAATSHAESLNFLINQILKAGQRKNAGTFYTFYRKEIIFDDIVDNEKTHFSETFLTNA